MQTLSSTTLIGDSIKFPGGSGEMVWDAASTGTGTLILERMSSDANSGSTWTQVGASGIGAGVAQLTAAGTLIFTAGPCWLRMRATSPTGNILCELKRCHAGRTNQD